MPILSNPRWERFAQEVENMNAEGGAYVYDLIDPRTGIVFYVGKGRRRRAWQHERDARRGRISNIHKHLWILEIVEAGFSVEVRIVARFNTDFDAGEAEKARIAEIGLENLTNIAKGGGCAECGTSVPRDNLPKLLCRVYSNLLNLKAPEKTKDPELALKIRGEFQKIYRYAYEKLGDLRSEEILCDFVERNLRKAA